MNDAKLLRRNSYFSLLSAAIRFLTNALMFIGIARIFGPIAFGSFSTAYVLSNILVIIADFGFDMLLMTEVAKNKPSANRIVHTFFPFKLLLSLIALSAIWFLPTIYKTSEITKHLIFVFSFSVIFTSLTNFFFALFRGLEQFEHEVKITFIINLVLLLALIILGSIKSPILVIAMIFTLTRGAGLLLATLKANKLIKLERFNISFKKLQDNWRTILVYGFTLIFGNLFFQLVTPFLAFLKGDYEVGIFESVFKIVGLVLIFSDIIVNSMTPTLSRLILSHESQWFTLGKLINKTFLLISLPLAFFFFTFPEQILNLLYGVGKFKDAIPIMEIAAFVILVRYVSETYGLILTVSSRQLQRMIITGIGTILTIVLCSLVIPSFGIVGAALVSLVVNIIVGIGYILQNRSIFKNWSFDKSYLIPIFLTIVFGYVFKYAYPLSWILAILFFITIYAISAYYICFSKKERSIIFTFNKEELNLN